MEAKDSKSSKEKYLLAPDSKEILDHLILKEIINHCKTCTFKIHYYNIDGEDIKEIDDTEKSCALKVWMANNFSMEFNEYIPIHPYRPCKNLNVLKLLLLQPILNDEQLLHQVEISNLLLKTKINFTADCELIIDNRRHCMTDYLITKKNYRCLEMVVNHGVNVNEILINSNDASQSTLLHICGQAKFRDIEIKTKILLRAGADIGMKYAIGQETTNVYRHYLNELRSATDERKQYLLQFTRLLRSYQRAKNVMSRRVGKYRRRKLIDALSFMFGVHMIHNDLLYIISEYAIPISVVRI